jgi:hypothetical protein
MEVKLEGKIKRPMSNKETSSINPKAQSRPQKKT